MIKVLGWFTFLQHEFVSPVPVILEDPTSTKTVSAAAASQGPDPADLPACLRSASNHTCSPGWQVTWPSVFEPPTKTLSIVIPAYDEEDRLPATLEETLR